MIEQIKNDFEKAIKNLNLTDKKIELRKKNLESFIEKGFPNKRVEEWKFSDLNQILSSNIKELSFFKSIPPKGIKLKLVNLQILLNLITP